MAVKPISLVSSLSVPFSTKILGQYFTLNQPPFPAGDEPEEVSTSQWAALTPVMRGSTHLARLVPLMDGKVGDGVGFPAVVPYSVGVVMENLDLEFGVSTFRDTA